MEVNVWRLELLRKAPRTLPNEDGVLIINEHRNCKWGKRTAHEGRQWSADIGKTNSGVVSATSLLMDEKIYWPVGFEPYTPDRHFGVGERTPPFAPS